MAVNFVTVYSNNIEDLNTKVNIMLAQGYAVTGGLTVISPAVDVYVSGNQCPHANFFCGLSK